jgi:putative endonuclease
LSPPRQRSTGARRAAERGGREAEDTAAGWLAGQGWMILDRRARGPRGSGAGELDLVALDATGAAPVVVFVEVKARPTLAAALESVTPAQRRRLAVAAEGWLAAHPEHAAADVRFDVVCIVPDGPPTHLPDAWRPEG